MRRLIGGAKQLAARLGAGGSRRAREAAAVTTSLTTGSSNETTSVSFTERKP